MIFDGQLQFTGVAGTFSTDSPTTGTQTSTNTLDMGARVDWGVAGDPTVKLAATCTTAFSGGTSLQLAIEGSVDNSTFTRMLTGPVILEANLTVGTHLFDVDLPRIAGAWYYQAGPSQALPRYLRLAYVSVGTHSTGALFAGLLLDRHDKLDTGYSISGVTIVPN